MRQLRKKEVNKRARELRTQKKEAGEKMRNQEIILLLDNVQYARNVASIFRIADAAGVKKLYLTGISQTPPFGKELKQVSRHKEKTVTWEYEKDAVKLVSKLKEDGYWICAIEYTDESFPIDKLPFFAQNKQKICFIPGNEGYGVTNKVLALCNASVHIPMYGRGASINVTHAVAVTLFRL